MKITLIYLAAGNSRRFGSNKLFYKIDGKEMYRHLLERLSEICARHENRRLLVVTQYEEIRNAAQKLGVEAVFSPDSQKGISYTLRAGLLAAERNQPDAYAFFVADQPYLSEKTVEGFLEKMENGRKKLGSVCCKGKPGNPTWFDASYKEELLALEGDCGGRAVLKRHPNEVLWYEVTLEEELRDIDER